MLEGNSLDTLFVVKDTKSRRVSSSALDGSNADMRFMKAGSTLVAMDYEGTGIIRHIWCTVSCGDLGANSLVVLRMYWDNEETPSVEVPYGDFFGTGMDTNTNFVSEPLNKSPRDGRAFNCFFPMPFSSHARIEFENQSDWDMNVYYYIDYEEVPEIPDDYGRFHAQWRRESATGGVIAPENQGPSKLQNIDGRSKNWPASWDVENRDGAGNYVILEANGKGHYVGCNLSICNFEKQPNDWYGEGDDMIFIDDDELPTINGTGTEDYFSTCYCPKTTYSAPWHGITAYSGDEIGRPWAGINCMYRFHIKDPIRFQKSIRVTIEHGHANQLNNDYSSTAYWYQVEPHDPTYRLPEKEKRIPRKNEDVK